MKFTLLIPIIALLVSCSSREQGADSISLKKGWKIQAGDNPEWADPDYDDSKWHSIDPGSKWENQEIDVFEEYDGYAWYRISFKLPEDLLRNSYFGKELQISLGRIDDTEQTYLNGRLLGMNGKVSESSVKKPGKFEGDPVAYSYFRKYIIQANDERINWGGRNVIAIRVHDQGGGGGMSFSNPAVSMVDIKDFITLDITSDPFEIMGDHFTKSIKVLNTHQTENFDGVLTVKASRYSDDKVFYHIDEDITLMAGGQFDYILSFSAPQAESYRIEYIFKPNESHSPVYRSQGAPYILTPPPSDEPRINGPGIFGVRAGNPILYTIPVSGRRPIQYSAEGLPEGITLDSVTGHIRGMIRKEGDYKINLVAVNDLGEDQKHFTIKVGNEIQLTPPMGWNSWNCWGLSVSDEKVRSSAKAMVSSGLANYGWSYINIDDGWEADQRTYSGELPANDKFPDMKGLSDYIHGLGLKIGIYSSPGPYTCGGYLGSYQHEWRDARTWADWEIDYLKYDWCSYGTICPDDTDPDELKKPYLLMRAGLDRVKRDIVYSLCQYGMGNVSSWGAEVGGNLWRTTYDITDTWESLKAIGFGQDFNSEFSGPGHYNDPDMMILGSVGWGPNLRPTRLTPDEQYTHVSLWCLLSAPLLLGNDLSNMDDFTLNLLSNTEVLALNQDPLCRQAKPVYKDEEIQVWMKELSDGSLAAGFFNMTGEYMETEIPLERLDLKGNFQVRDLWRQQDGPEIDKELEVQIMPHGVYLVKLTEL